MKTSAPYGHRIVKDDREQEAIRFMVGLRNGGMSYYEICRELEKSGYEPRGERWYEAVISKILKREQEKQDG